MNNRNRAVARRKLKDGCLNIQREPLFTGVPRSTLFSSTHAKVGRAGAPAGAGSPGPTLAYAVNFYDGQHGSLPSQPILYNDQIVLDSGQLDQPIPVGQKPLSSTAGTTLDKSGASGLQSQLAVGIAGARAAANGFRGFGRVLPATASIREFRSGAGAIFN